MSSLSPKEEESELFDASNGLILCDTFIPEEVLINILVFVKWNDLKSCRSVCQLWKRIVDSVVSFEKLKYFNLRALNESFSEPPLKIQSDQVPFYLYFAIGTGGFGKNLMKNLFGSGEVPHECRVNSEDRSVWTRWLRRERETGPKYANKLICSQDDCPKFKHWGVLANGGDGWAVEAVPLGCEPLPSHLSGSSCFVTSYRVCKKEQLIKLSEHGLNPTIMDTVQPQFDVSEWYARRFDCGMRYRLQVKLLDENEEVVYEDVVEKGEGLEDNEWHQASLCIKDYGPGVRYVLFIHSGCDTQFWAGYYGSKMAGASVIARIPTNKYLHRSDPSSLD